MSSELTEIYSTEQLDLIKNTLWGGDLTPGEFMTAMFVAKKRNLSPFERQIYAFVQVDRRTGKRTLVCQATIDGFRAIAHRTGRLNGVSRKLIKDEKGRVIGAKTRVKVKGIEDPFIAEVSFGEYVKMYDGKPTGPWAKMPETMILKVSEAQAYRMAFPEDLSNLYTDDEIAEYETEINVTPKMKYMPGDEWIGELDPNIAKVRESHIGWYGRLGKTKREWVDVRLRDADFRVPLTDHREWTGVEFAALTSIRAELKNEESALKAKARGREERKELDAEFHQRVTVRDASLLQAEAEPPADAYRDFTGTAPARFEDKPDDIPWADPSVAKYEALKGRAFGVTVKRWVEEFSIVPDRLKTGPISEAELKALEAMITAQKRPTQPALIDDGAQHAAAVES